MTSETPSSPPPPGFKIGDAMFLVAAVALGLYLSRTSLDSILPTPPKKMVDAASWSRLRDSLPYAACILIPLTIACLILGLRDSRRGGRESLNSAGMTAVIAPSSVIGLLLLSTALVILSGASSDFVVSPVDWGRTSAPGSGVAGAWASSWLGGRSRRGRTWPDRLGIVLGLGWVGLMLAQWLGFALIR